MPLRLAFPVPGRINPKRVLDRCHEALRRGLADVADFVYPPMCVLCECDAPSDAPLCDGCLEELTALEQAVTCPHCAKPVAVAGEPCPWCDGRGVGRIKRMCSLGLYEGPLRQLIHRAKYHGRWELAEWLGRRLSVRPGVQALLAETDVLISVPLHPSRQVHRGYNQSGLIARQLGRLTGVALISPAVRTRATAAQTSLTSALARQANMRDAFLLIDPDAVAGKRVTLVDDVTTTGATLRSLANAIHAAGPAALGAIVAAVADPRRKTLDADLSG